jgi:hypothetical protein
MKTYRVIYLPHGREDKEWMDVQASNPEEILKTFKSGVIIDIREDN